ncbi:MAG: NADH-quinone oxidoreductase subunit NuoE [Rhizobiales bacterium]|nr:NADH-quinone oxidoreductase subunit NuoE [Hyphomicrobiales bacterium]
MSVRRLDPVQPKNFKFTPANLKWARDTIKKYPKGKQASAVIPILWRAQEQHDGWTSEAAIRCVAEMLDMSYIRVYEVATFYTMFQLSPVGKRAHIQVCGTTPCMLRGAEDLIKVCKSKIAGQPHQVTADGNLSWEEVECLGACTNAPMVQIFKDVYEDLTPQDLEHIIDSFAAGKTPRTGPYNGRQFSAPLGELTSLTDESLYNGKTRPAPAARKSPGKPAAPVKKAAAPARKTTAAKRPAKAAKPAEKGQPAAIKKPARPDDLKLISGVGPKLEGVLNGLGIYRFDQIAKWTKAEREWVDGYLNFKGRIERDEWIKQAKALAKGVK